MLLARYMLPGMKRRLKWGRASMAYCMGLAVKARVVLSPGAGVGRAMSKVRTTSFPSTLPGT